MRNLLFFLVVFFSFAACKKNNTPVTPTSNNNPSNPGNPNNPNNPGRQTAWYIPNWYSGDTLVGDVLDSMNQFTGERDTIFTLTVNDTSFIVYRSQKYYIWTESIFGTDTFVSDAQQYTNCRIGTAPDSAHIVSSSTMNSVGPHKYKDQQGNWTYQRQQIMLGDWKHFRKVNFGHYSALNTKP